jgi:hypothetical protein
MTIGALRAVGEHELRVPDGIALVGYDDIEYAPHITPPLTIVAIPRDNMGRLVVRKAIAQLDDGSGHVFGLTRVSHALVVGSSCGAKGGRTTARHTGRAATTETVVILSGTPAVRHVFFAPALARSS